MRAVAAPSKQVRRQRATRAYRRMLGFCINCTEPAAPGGVRCARHTAADTAARARFRKRVARARGWKMVRIKA